jgi:hypothetical protein
MVIHNQFGELVGIAGALTAFGVGGHLFFLLPMAGAINSTHSQ